MKNTEKFTRVNFVNTPPHPWLRPLSLSISNYSSYHSKIKASGVHGFPSTLNVFSHVVDIVENASH